MYPHSGFLVVQGNIRQNHPFVRGFEKGLATNRAQNTSKIDPQNCVPLLLRVAKGKRTQKRGLNLWHWKDLLAPTPSGRQPPFRNFCSFSKQGSTPTPWARGSARPNPKRARQTQKSFMHRVCSARRGSETMVSDDGLGKGQTMGYG